MVILLFGWDSVPLRRDYFRDLGVKLLAVAAMERWQIVISSVSFM